VILRFDVLARQILEYRVAYAEPIAASKQHLIQTSWIIVDERAIGGAQIGDNDIHSLALDAGMLPGHDIALQDDVVVLAATNVLSTLQNMASAEIARRRREDDDQGVFAVRGRRDLLPHGNASLPFVLLARHCFTSDAAKTQA
jgi:hypothetical protein